MQTDTTRRIGFGMEQLESRRFKAQKFKGLALTPGLASYA
jgi:hypothetical protein